MHALQPPPTYRDNAHKPWGKAKKVTLNTVKTLRAFKSVARAGSHTGRESFGVAAADASGSGSNPTDDHGAAAAQTLTMGWKPAPPKQGGSRGQALLALAGAEGAAATDAADKPPVRLGAALLSEAGGEPAGSGRRAGSDQNPAKPGFSILGSKRVAPLPAESEAVIEGVQGPQLRAGSPPSGRSAEARGGWQRTLWSAPSSSDDGEGAAAAAGGDEPGADATDAVRPYWSPPGEPSLKFCVTPPCGDDDFQVQPPL